MVSAPSFGRMSVLEALRAGLRSAQAALEGSQSSAFGPSSMGQGGLGAAMVVAALCPLHGPVIQSAATELIYKYRCASCTGQATPPVTLAPASAHVCQLQPLC